MRQSDSLSNEDACSVVDTNDPEADLSELRGAISSGAKLKWPRSQLTCQRTVPKLSWMWVRAMHNCRLYVKRFKGQSMIKVGNSTKACESAMVKTRLSRLNPKVEVGQNSQNFSNVLYMFFSPSC